jgi:hypothetical protein
MSVPCVFSKFIWSINVHSFVLISFYHLKVLTEIEKEIDRPKRESGVDGGVHECFEASLLGPGLILISEDWVSIQESTTMSSEHVTIAGEPFPMLKAFGGSRFEPLTIYSKLPISDCGGLYRFPEGRGKTVSL